MTMFSELDIEPALAEAIATRGYETATPVQVAVAAVENLGRDLLVSSQTGSGKTLAFGTLLARVLLSPPKEGEGETPPAKHRKGRSPSALVIAPTRELANQVRTELGWLFAKTGLHVAAFTGGSDIFRDLKNLQAGVDIAVGTPGRLVDLMNREALRLSDVRVAVLDEADEMLDMGFREDMETLLGAAEHRQNTHMFSATLPRPILTMAAKFQKDAKRIDARVLGESSSHEDIRYVAHLIAIGDRFQAVINVLLQHPDERAIVFGTTRDGVADLHQELVKHGFKAVVLSGDRAQAERNRALSALRSGEAKILVATNVAARGLDLPEVDLVVHADLPLNVEALTHRSGRTGRAGRKGTSVLIANVAERRKAERLLDFAKIDVKWSHAPSAEDIANRNEATLEADLRDAATSEEPPSSSAIALLERLGEDVSQERLLLRLLDRELARVPRGEEVRYVDFDALKQGVRPRRDMGPPPSRADFSRSAVRFKVSLGSDSKAEPGWLLPLICRRGGVTRRDVGAIRVFDRHSEFEISDEAANDFALAAAQPDPRAPHVFIERVGSGGRPRDVQPTHFAKKPKAKAPAFSERPMFTEDEAPAVVEATPVRPAPEPSVHVEAADEEAPRAHGKGPAPVIKFGKLRRMEDNSLAVEGRPAAKADGFATPKRKVRSPKVEGEESPPAEASDGPIESGTRAHDGSLPPPHSPPPWKKDRKPSFEKPAFGKPAFGKGKFEKPFGKPAFGKPAFGKGKFEKPFGKPAFGKGKFEKPFGKPAFGKGKFEKPFGKPAFAKGKGKGKPFAKKPK